MDFKLGKVQYGFLSTATAAGTLTLTNTSKQIQVFTGTSTHIMKLPDATTVGTGISFTVINQSTGTITVQDNGANVIGTIPAGASTDFLLTDASTSNGVWRIGAFTATGGGGVGYKGILAKSASYSIVSNDTGYIINVDATGGAYTMTLPAPASGFIITIKDIAGRASLNNITVAPNSTETIDATNSDIISENYAAVSYISDGTNWFKIAAFTSVGDPSVGSRAVFAGGYNSGYSNVMDYVSIATLGNAQDFGDLTSPAQSENSGGGSTTRGVYGNVDTGAANNRIDYITFNTLGNATSFGQLTTSRFMTATASSGTRAVWENGYNGGQVNVIDYVTIATTGNATSFGSAFQTRSESAGFASPTRGIYSGGFTGTNTAQSTMDYITIATTGNSLSFGTLGTARYGLSGASNSTRGLITSGNTNQTLLEYATIATLGNATTFGNLPANRQYVGCATNATRCLMAGGYDGSTYVDIIYYVDLATIGTVNTFGNLSSARYLLSGASSAHGGI